MNCPACKKGEIKESRYYKNVYDCSNRDCDIDGEIIDGFFYPELSRGQLCSVYTATKDLIVSKYNVGDKIAFRTARSKVLYAEVLHIGHKDDEDVMTIKDEKGELRILIDQREVESAYDALFPSSRIKFKGWHNKKIEIEFIDYESRKNHND